MTQNQSEDVLTALRDELAAVSPSPEFADRVRQRIAGDLPLLREELAAVTPSPEFKARVRQQIEAGGARAGSRWLDWRWLVPVAAAAGIAIVVAWTWRDAQNAPAPVVTTAVHPAPVVRTPAPPPVEQRTAAPIAASPLRHERTGVRSSTEETSLEVITNQPAILRALAARIAAGAEMVETTTAPETVPDIAVPAIVIDPIVVKPLPEPPDVSSVLPIIRRITAK
jgi:hypothetical protein